MRGFPATCIRCGHTFSATNFIGGPGTASFSLVGCSITCARCGGTALLGDGQYAYEAGLVRLINGPPLTRAMMGQLAGIAARAKEKIKSGNITADEILSEVAGVSPELAEKIKANYGYTAFAIILFLLFLIKNVSIDVSVDLNLLLQQVWSISQTGDYEKYLDEAVPVEPPDDRRDTLSPPSTWAGRQSPTPNRQARRRQQALEKRRRKGRGPEVFS